LPQLYRLLYAYASVVLDTMAEHREWDDARYAERVKREKIRTDEALREMEVLKPVIDAEAEAWKVRMAASKARAGERAETVTVAGRERASDGSASASTSRAEGAPRSVTVDSTVAGSKASDEVLSRHAMFGARLPTAGETAAAAGSARDHASRATIADARAVSPSSSPTPSAPPARFAEARHAHSLLPPPPPPPAPDDEEGSFSQDIMYNAASVDFQPKVIMQFPTTDEAATDHTRLDTRLKLYNLREKVVRGDGNCQFRAIADQLFRDQERHAECRSVVINQLRRRSEDYSPYVPEDFDAYVEAMRKDGCWGDHITLQAAADAYGVRMCVISSYKDNFIVEVRPKTQRSSRVCWISFWAEVHYNSLYGATDASA